MSKYLSNTALRFISYALAVLPIFIFRDFTPDNELRYLSIADEALANDSVFTFNSHSIIYADKPPLYLWIVMLGKALFGHHSMLFLGMFSLLPALVVIFVMDKWVKDLLSAEEKFSAELMLLTSVFFVGSAIVLRMDMLMCMFIVLALYTFFKMYENKGSRFDSFLFPVYVFLALFTKGPVGLIVPLVSVITFLVLKKEYKLIKKYWGWKTLSILIFLSGIWFIGVYAEGGREYLNNLLFKQTVNRAVNAFHHKEPFYYYFIAIWYTLAPWSLLIGAILWNFIKKQPKLSNLELFFIVIALSTIVTLSLFSSKLAVYILPTSPFFVYLSMIWLHKIPQSKWYSILMSIPSAILILAFPATLIYKYFFKETEFVVSLPIVLASAMLTVAGTITLKFLLSNKLLSGIQTLGAGLMASVFVVSFAIPGLNHLIGLNHLCSQAKAIADEKGGVNYYYCGLSRANNFNVYLESELKELKKPDLLADDKIITPAIVFVSGKELRKNDTLKTFARGRNIFHTGNYYCIELENKKQND